MPNNEIIVHMVVEADKLADVERLVEFAVGHVTSAVRKSNGGTVAAVLKDRSGETDLYMKSGPLTEEMQAVMDRYANEAHP